MVKRTSAFIGTLMALAACVSEPSTGAVAALLRIDPNQPGLSYCAPNSELAIGGVGLGMTEAQVVARLGPPDAIQRAPELRVDFVDTRLVYPGLEVDLLQDAVVDIYATTAGWATPSGIGVGLSQQAVWDLFDVPLNRIASSATDSFHQIYGCDFAELGEGLNVFINDDLQVTAVTVFSDKP